MASPDTWRKLRYFKPNSLTDNWGDSRAICDDLLLRLDDFRHFIGSPIIVTSGVRNSKSGSYHGSMIVDGFETGKCAVDIIVPSYEQSPFDLVLDATRFQFHGLGFYPHWQRNGEVTGGLHLDCRLIQFDNDDTLDYKSSRWMGVMDQGKQIYVPLTFENMIKYSMYGEDLDSSVH